MMLVFPQLSTGAYAQFPVVRSRSRRTIRNEMADRSSVVYSDGGAGLVRWDLMLRGLTSDEADAITRLFDAAEGKLRTFTFLDPAGNLLEWSEDLGKPAWQADPMLQILPGVGDPLGTLRGTHLVNAGQATQRVGQTLPVPGWFAYCFSLYAKSDAGSTIWLIRSSATGTETLSVPLSSSWQRITAGGNLGASATSMSFEIELPAGAAVSVFGLQAEAQVEPSAYMRTEGNGGVYPAARFDQDELILTAQGLEDTDVSIRILSPDGV